MENLIGEFHAMGDDGQSYRINVYHQQTLGEQEQTAVAPEAASMVLRTMIGQLLTRTAKGVYRVRETGVKLRSSATNAP